MSTTIALKPDFDVSGLVIDGDLSRLTPEGKSQYYILRCKEHGLSPSSQPFNYLKINGKEVLYANKGCAEQLRSIYKISIKITKAEQVGDLFVVIAEAKNGDGREDSDVGAVPTAGLKGEALANAMMKAQTKAKRRVTLSICGLNMLDETEIDSLPPAAKGGIYPEAPGENDGAPNETASKLIGFGKWRHYTIEQVIRDQGYQKVIDYVAWLEDEAKKKNQPIDPNSLPGIFIKDAEILIGNLENSELTS